MPKFTEEQLKYLSYPASRSEEAKITGAAQILKKALNKSNIVNSSDYEVFGQGSYANNTNIRLNSDIDINVCYTKGFYYTLPEGTTKSDYGLGGHVSYSFKAFKDNIEEMLVEYYGRNDVVRKNKCITVKGNTNRIEVDVVPTWEFRRYDKPYDKSYFKGVRLYPDDAPNSSVENYPKQHLEYGVAFNSKTKRRFKRLTRIFKNIRIKMRDENYYSNDNVSSFLLECLMFNVPEQTYTNAKTKNDLIKQAIYFIWNGTKEETKEYEDWVEVSRLLYLMRGSIKWSRQDVHNYMYNMWNYMEYHG